MSAPVTRTSPDEVTLSDVVNALEHLVTADSTLDATTGGTGVFAHVPGGSPITRWVVADGVAGLTLTTADGRSFSLTLSADQPVEQP